MYVVGIFFLEDRVSSIDTLNSCPPLLQHKPEDTSIPDRLSELPCRHECIRNYGIPHHLTFFDEDTSSFNVVDESTIPLFVTFLGNSNDTIHGSYTDSTQEEYSSNK